MRLKCFIGYHEYDLWIARFMTPLKDYLDHHFATGWGWFKIPYEEFGAAYYYKCKHCGRTK